MMALVFSSQASFLIRNEYPAICVPIHTQKSNLKISVNHLKKRKIDPVHSDWNDSKKNWSYQLYQTCINFVVVIEYCTLNVTCAAQISCLFYGRCCQTPDPGPFNEKAQLVPVCNILYNFPYRSSFMCGILNTAIFVPSFVAPFSHIRSTFCIFFSAHIFFSHCLK